MVFDLHWVATEVGYCEPGRLDMIRSGIALRSPLWHSRRRWPALSRRKAPDLDWSGGPGYPVADGAGKASTPDQP